MVTPARRVDTSPHSWLLDGRAAEEQVRMAKILVIDDDVIVRMTIVRLLEEAGHDVLAAKDGLRGMAVFRNTEPDLVITDIIMPEQEGIQTISEMRKAKPDAKIIVMSGSGRIGDTDFLEIAKAGGAMAVIPKPFDMEELLALVRDCLGKAA
jgi:CheY-like chemotaxis protein